MLFQGNITEQNTFNNRITELFWHTVPDYSSGYDMGFGLETGSCSK